jgi:hypothetical protein
MPRTRAVLPDPDRSLVQNTLMDQQAYHERRAADLAKRYSREIREHLEQALAARRAQERVTAATFSAERDTWDGSCRRHAPRRSADSAAA